MSNKNEIDLAMANARQQLDIADRDPNPDRRFGRVLIAIGALLDVIEQQQRQIDALEAQKSR